MPHKYRDKVYRIDHRELSTDLAFWNDFISHAVSPQRFYQKLQGYHGRMITTINYVEQFDLGVVMCLTLDWHLKKKKQLIFPHTITQLCKIAGIDVRNIFEDIRSQPQKLGAKIFARMANTRVDPEYIDVDVKHVAGENDEESSDDQSADEDGQRISCNINMVLQQLLSG